MWSGWKVNFNKCVKLFSIVLFYPILHRLSRVIDCLIGHFYGCFYLICSVYKIVSLFALVGCFNYSLAQDTYSIVAVDSITGEVGSAGASCVDLFETSLANDDFLGVLFPGKGAINTQAYYVPSNQDNATVRMNAGDNPQQIIDWLTTNDVNGTPQLRQYGVAALVDGIPQTAAHTGESTDDYKGHIIGRNYAIQGNILKGKEVLEGIEAGFLQEEGDLACKLMAALQGANMVGADARCASNGTSALFAFIKVSKPGDAFGSPSFSVSVRTRSGARIEPLDTLQTKFEEVHTCAPISAIEDLHFDAEFTIWPNPTSSKITISTTRTTSVSGSLKVLDAQGRSVVNGKLHDYNIVDLSELPKGLYLIEIYASTGFYTKKVIKN